jgi:anti-anti-sigma factor
MSEAALIRLAAGQPADAAVVVVVPPDRRLTTGLDIGPGTRASLLDDELLQLASRTVGPVVVDMLGVDWIDSGACAVLIRFWKSLRGKGRALTLAVTSPVRETFRITGLERLIPCYGTLEAAVEGARKAQPAVASETRA